MSSKETLEKDNNNIYESLNKKGVLDNIKVIKYFKIFLFFQK